MKTSFLMPCLLVLTHYNLVLLFCTPWKHQKTYVFRGYRKATLGCKGLNWTLLTLIHIVIAYRNQRSEILSLILETTLTEFLLVIRKAAGLHQWWFLRNILRWSCRCSLGVRYSMLLMKKYMKPKAKNYSLQCRSKNRRLTFRIVV